MRMATKGNKRRTFIALTIMGIAAAIGILNRNTVKSIGPVAMVFGVLFVAVVVYLLFTKTNTGQEYADGAKETAKDAKETAEKVKEKARDLGEDAKEALGKAGDKAEDLVRKGKDLIDRG